jgi:sialate O-acetylesterase
MINSWTGRRVSMVRYCGTSAAILLVLALVTAPALADVRLPSVFGDHMVLQRELAIPVWGWADAGERVVVELADQRAEATADADGRWSVKLGPLPAGGPHEMAVVGGNQVTLHDVLIGEVWVCSGQSNMQFSVRAALSSTEEIAAAIQPKLRMFTVKRVPHDAPQDDCEGSWAVCTPETAGSFSAVGYYFARALVGDLKVPVGMLHTSWGGTLCEAWTSDEALRANDDFQAIIERRATTKGPQNRASALYNGMLKPLIPYGIRGAIWYQGESNLSRAFQYRTLFPTMIRDWRKCWGQGDFPFLFVQLAPYRYNGQDQRNCAELWEAQFKTLALPNTGMAVTVDIGDLRDIHPKNKQDVGRRLALWALAKTYGKKIECSGPLYKSLQIEGDAVRLTFDHLGGGLASRDDKPLTDFTIAAKDQQFLPATAVIDGDQVVVQSPAVKKPLAVRYGWYDSAQPNLINKTGLPASPFRTDDWPAVTRDNK